MQSIHSKEGMHEQVALFSIGAYIPINIAQSCWFLSISGNAALKSADWFSSMSMAWSNVSLLSEGYSSLISGASLSIFLVIIKVKIKVIIKITLSATLFSLGSLISFHCC